MECCAHLGDRILTHFLKYFHHHDYYYLEIFLDSIKHSRLPCSFLRCFRSSFAMATNFASKQWELINDTQLWRRKAQLFETQLREEGDLVRRMGLKKKIFQRLLENLFPVLSETQGLKWTGWESDLLIPSSHWNKRRLYTKEECL